MSEKSPEISRPSQEISPDQEKEKKLFELMDEAEKAETTPEKTKILREMKEVVGEGDKELGELEKKLFSEHIRETNETLKFTQIEVGRYLRTSEGLNINYQEIADDVEEKDFKIIKKDKPINPETGKKTNINRIEFDLELKYPNKEKETLRFVSLEIPGEYKDLTKCHVYKELIENTKAKPWAPKLKQRFDQKFITWQKEMMRVKNNPEIIRTNIPLENSKEPTDIKRETLKRGMRTMSIEENIILAEMLKRNGFSIKDWTSKKYEQWAEQNKEKVEKFLGIKDLWTPSDKWYIRDFAFYTGKNGKKHGFLRGGSGARGSRAGVFALHLGNILSTSLTIFGFRCAR